MKANVYFTIIKSIKQDGKLPKVSISKQAINRYVSKLKKEDIIKKLGYGTWTLTGKKFNQKEVNKEVNIKYPSSQNALYTTPSKNIRGHGFILTFQIPKIAGWKSRETFFKKKGIKFNKIGTYGHSIRIRGYILHLYNNNIVIYTPKHKSYFSDNANTSSKYAIYDILQVFQTLENKLGVSLHINKSFKFKVSRQHYAKIKDSLARMYKRDGSKLEIRNESGVWLIADNSLNLEELETIHQKTAHQDMDKVIIPFFNDLKAHYEQTGESIRITEILNIMKFVATNQKMFAENIDKHMEVLENLNKGIIEFRETVKKNNNFPMENK